MQHYHYTNIDHGHKVNDPGHKHHLITINGAGDNTYQGGSNGLWIRNSDTDTDLSYTGIYLDNVSNDNRLSGGSISDVYSTPRTLTDSNDTNAIETRPTNFTVKIWKRTD